MKYAIVKTFTGVRIIQWIKLCRWNRHEESKHGAICFAWWPWSWCLHTIRRTTGIFYVLSCPSDAPFDITWNKITGACQGSQENVDWQRNPDAVGKLEPVRANTANQTRKAYLSSTSVPEPCWQQWDLWNRNRGKTVSAISYRSVCQRYCVLVSVPEFVW